MRVFYLDKEIDFYDTVKVHFLDYAAKNRIDIRQNKWWDFSLNRLFYSNWIFKNLQSNEWRAPVCVCHD